MNTIEAYFTSSPFNTSEECAKLTLEEPLSTYILSGITASGQKYTLSFWVKADTACSLNICGEQISVTTSWLKHVITFTASEQNISFQFGNTGVYYIYCPKLEKGHKATDWTPAPEDVDEGIENAQTTADQANESATSANERVTIAETVIEQLSDSISMLVRDENGESLMTQTENGWTFSMKETNEAVSGLSSMLETLQEESGGTQAAVEALQKALSGHDETLQYVTVTTYEDEPCIELGKSTSDFKLLITNTRIMFMNGSNIPTYINTNGLVTQDIEVKGKIVHGGYTMMNTSDGGWGLLWTGVNS